MSKNNSRFFEEDIRPSNLMTGQMRAMAIDVERLKSKKKEFVVVACPACGSDIYRKKFTKYGMQFVECSECETFFTNPRPTPKILAWFYKDSVNYDYWNKYIFPSSEKIRREKIIVPRVNLILDICRKFNIKTDSLLEVGAGHGTFCQEVLSRKIFKRVVAIEPVISQAKTCVEKGIETINMPVENVKFKRNELFNVIVNFEVMEHLFSPKEFITDCRKFLKNNGLLVFTLPNGKGFDINLLGKISDSIDHEHLNYFNPRSIELLLNRCGMQLVQILTPGKLDAELVRKKILSKEFSIPDNSFLNDVLIDNWDRYGNSFQTFIANYGLSSHMLIIAKK
jgi:2-polyprenyl-3-methyl-5-hydroxy-6-metoxy-1,4-benzoquinol methylase/predicted RNA-binding Zn-ribbon protein involved in translation (DUF1610 family)